MAKNPAVSFYFNDWHGGTVNLSRFLKGCYMDLLYAQFNLGGLTLDDIKTVLGSDFGSAWPALQKKFVKVESTGLYQNERLFFEVNKRVEYNESRARNKNARKTTQHMEIYSINESLFFLLPATYNHIEFKELWFEFSKARKKKMTERAENLNVKTLIGIAGEDWALAKKCMENAIQHGWQTFYPPKETEPKGRYSHENQKIPAWDRA